MSLAPWRTFLARALHRNRSLVNARYCQLATVRAEKMPANRTVVFRGFLGETNTLKIVTDARSEKAGQIESHPWGEICWYFPKTREQFRLFGELILVGENHGDEDLQKARQIAWQELSDGARVQFAWPEPGKTRASFEAFSPALPDAVEPLGHFCLLLLEPTKVEHLELRGEPQNRRIYELDGEKLWREEEVNP
ncbi:pyridoxamine 5'-phosphate oxidase family protein [Ancylothrix sp. C2]|uniref:Npun_F5749 family FMN-dependent PPOX-type flavoprotein n=1 Tax=Ancylothrix sp. D3o TaxID=2953691 RepID=UPI0021BA5AF8|nr:Npun_F5749 family FMN-dependent PPOX-type flavoprotein [Ancylothrix sp. D3o]MCT7950450.1 pyridoxamine 5'-phosphate oxidase family protein [Ancylothrix sp. D3o]